MKIKETKIHNGIISFWKFMFCLMIVIFHGQIFATSQEEILMIKGSIGVEFFFLVSGYLMTKSALKKQDDTTNLGKETLEFIWKKIKNFFPYILICHIMGLIVLSIYDTMTIKDYVLSLLDLLLVRMAGFKLTIVNGLTWYISAMLIAMIFLYPLIRKYKYNFIYIVCPLIVLLLGGWIDHTYGTIRTPALWTGFAYKGFLRAIVELSIGSLIFVATESIKKINFTKIGKIFITIIEIFGFLIPFYASQFIPNSARYDFIMLIFLSISIALAFSEKTCEYKKFNNKLFYHLEKLSLPLYLCHVVLRTVINEMQLLANFNYYQKLLIFLVISLIIAEMMMFIVEKLKKKNYYINNLKKILIQV